jgi:hypothetical protein
MKRNRKKKRRGFFGMLFGTIGVLILIVLLSAAGLAAYVLISMNRDPVVTRTVQEYADTQPDTSFRHLSFTEDGMMTQSYSEEDIGWFISQLMAKEKIDPESYLEDIPVPDLELRGFDLQLDEDRTAVCVEGAWRTIRIVARVLVDIDLIDGAVTVSPDAVEIAKIKIPFSLIDRYFKTDIAVQSVSYAPEPVVMKEITEISSGEGKLSFTGPMATEILDYAELPENRLRITRLSLKDYRYAAAVLDTQGEDPAVRYAAILPVITEDPDEYVEFMDQLFSLVSATANRKIGLSQKNLKMALRWMPEYEEYGYTDRRNESYDAYYVCFRMFKTISTKIARDYASGRLKVSGNEFTYNGKTFSFEDYFGSSFKIYRPFLGMDEGRMCIAKKERPSGSNAAMLLRGTDGFGYLVAIFGADAYSIIPLEEEMYRQYLASDTVPVIVIAEL